MTELQELPASAERSVTLAYDDLGGGEPTVVLLHGAFCDRTYFAHRAHELSRRYRVLNVDLRGHGQSAVPSDGYSLDQLAADVIGTCERAGVSRAVFCGHSMPVALKAVTQRPDLAAGLAFVDGAVLLPAEVRMGRLDPLVRALETDGWRDALQAFFGSVAGPAAERVKADIAAIPRHIAAPMLREIVESDFASELAAVGCPVLYVHAGIPTDLDRLREIKPDAIIETIPDAGHYVALTEPTQLNGILDRFLAGIAGSR